MAQYHDEIKGVNLKTKSIVDEYEVSFNGETRDLNANFVDPTELGNWVKLERIEWNDETIGNSISIQGDQYDMIRIVVSVTGTTGSGTSGERVAMRFNSDSGTNYDRIYINQSNGSTATGQTEALLIPHVRTDSAAAECIIYPKSGGDRILFVKSGNWRDNNTDIYYTETWKWQNTANEITTIDISNTLGTGNLTGFLEVQGWKTISPVELHSYELVKKLTPSNETIDYTFEMAPDDLIYIRGSYYTHSNGSTFNDALYFRPNGATSTFVSQWIYGTATNTSAQNFTTNGFLLGFSHVSAAFSNFEFEFQNINYSNKRQSITKSAYTAGTDERIYLMNNVWGDTSTEITSGQVYCASNITGEIYVYRLAKTYLTSSNPGLLKGMWQEYSDADTVTIKPGQIEINGTNCYNSSDTDVTLSGNLRSGESESSSTYYYLYAIKGTGRTLTYKFSSIAPTMDRFGNTVSSFEDCDSEQDWYHPNEGITWRYIGQVYNDSSSNIFAFDKCKPGYWESVWTAFTGSTDTNHALGKEIWSGDVVFSKDNPPTNTYKFDGFYVSSSGLLYGSSVEQRDNALTDVYLRFGSAGTFHDGSSWQTSGYYKLILKG